MTRDTPSGFVFDYDRAFSRNIGWVTKDEQQRLRRARVAVAGLGGVGGAHVLALSRLGIANFNITRDIATLVRDDGEFNPANHIDIRDSVTPRDMARLLAGLYQGKWLSPASRNLLISTMENCRTGTRRIPAQLPDGVTVAHKTGSLNNTSSDVGIVIGPDGHPIAMAIYVTGQGARGNREQRIAMIARALYDGYGESARQWANARYRASGSADNVAAN